MQGMVQKASKVEKPVQGSYLGWLTRVLRTNSCDLEDCEACALRQETAKLLIRARKNLSGGRGDLAVKNLKRAQERLDDLIDLLNGSEDGHALQVSLVLYTGYLESGDHGELLYEVNAALSHLTQKVRPNIH